MAAVTIKVKNPHKHLVAVDGAIFLPGQEREVRLTDRVRTALKQGLVVEVTPVGAAKAAPVEATAKEVPAEATGAVPVEATGGSSKKKAKESKKKGAK